MKKIFYLALLAALVHGDAFSQHTINSNSSDTVSVSTTYQLNQVTVTATRSPERIMEIPYAVSVISKDKLTAKKGYGLDEVLSSVPGVLAQSRYGNQDIRLTIRGFGARGAGDRSNAGTSRGIRIMLDGFPETEPDGRTSFDMVDLNLADNIEVVRSNASALWGNAAGGLVSISSVPEDENSFVNASVASGSFGLKYSNVRGSLKVKGGKLFASFSNISFNGWREHSKSSRSILNLGLSSELNEKISLGTILSATSNSFHIPGPLTLEQYNNSPAMANPAYLSNDERRFNRLGRLGIVFNYLIDSQNDVSASAFVSPKYLQRSERNTFRDFNRYHTGGNLIYKKRLISGSLENNLTAGIDEAYQDGAILFYNLRKPDNSRGSLKDNKREGANSFGAFLQDEIWYKQLSIILGGRYDNIAYYNENYMGISTKTDDRSFTRFTPKIGCNYRINILQSIYFNYGGGVEVPAGNETDPAGTYGQDTVYLINPLLDPIVSSTFELGYKQIIPLESKLVNFITCEAALYYIDVRNDIIPYQGGKFYFTAGKTSRQGIEMGLTAQLDFDLKIDGSFSYSINRYNDYTVDSVHYNRPGSYGDFKDNKIAGVPDMFYNAALAYTPSFLTGVFVNAGFRGMGKYFADDANAIEIPSFNIIDASIGFEQFKLTEHLYLKGFLSVNNLTDIKYASSAFINPDRDKTGSPMYLEAGLPRNYVLSVSLGVR